MLIATFGPPSAFTHWCLHALSTLSGVVLGDFDYISVSTSQDFATALSNRQKEHMNFFTDCPDRGLVETFENRRLPILVLAEDPRDVLGFIMRERSLNWQQAVRLASLTFATTAGLVASPLALCIARDGNLTVGEFLERVTTHFGLEAGREQLDEITHRLLPAGNASSSTEEAVLSQVAHAMPMGRALEISPEERLVVEPLLEAMRATTGGTGTSFRWPSELFVGSTGPEELLRQPIEMLGPARCLVYGPYLHLPAGVWEVTLLLEVAENFSGNHVDVDIFHGTILHMESFRLPVSGRMALIATFPVSESREPVQIRVIQREGAIEGLLRIGDVHVRRKDETALTQPS